MSKIIIIYAPQCTWVPYFHQINNNRHTVTDKNDILQAFFEKYESQINN